MSQAPASRRRVLAAGVATTALLLTGSTALTGCTASEPAPEGPDPLESPARRAEADAARAIAAAQLLTDANAGLATAARALAADRMAHATTLRAELRRVRPGPDPHSSSPPVASPPAAPPSASPPADPDLAGIRSELSRAMHAAQAEAAALVLTLPGYRAALVASVAACCATHAAFPDTSPPAHPDMETYWGHRGAPQPDMSPYRAGRGVPVGALQGALGAEHAAVWVYGVAGAFVSGALAGRIEEAATAHQACRDATQRMLIGAGALPVPSEPGYLTPEPVTDAPSALRLVITAETDAAAAWRSVVERSPADPDLRGAALDALTAAAVRATRWRAATGAIPTTVPFPGTP